jgi:hypothetical protein
MNAFYILASYKKREGKNLLKEIMGKAPEG